MISMAFTTPLPPTRCRTLPRPSPRHLRPPRPPQRPCNKRVRMAVSPVATSVNSSYWNWGAFGKVHYRHAGTSGPVVLFVPGFGCGAFHFEENVAGLAPEGFRVYALDKLGLGLSTVASEAVAENMTLETWRDQIVAFIEEVLHGERVFLAGNSLGGLLAA
eukprot:IDg19534t1